MKNTTKDLTPGVGLDIGTMNIVSAREGSDGTVFKSVRDAFLDLDSSAEKSLKLGGISYIVADENSQRPLIVTGNDALDYASMSHREARRPLSRGVISAGELQAQYILSVLIKQVLGEPLVPKEKCYYSIPASPIDIEGQDVVYHEAVFNHILKDLGFEPFSMNEAEAVVYSECSAGTPPFSGLAVSFGSGMANIALVYRANRFLEFSVARGGDFVDEQAAKAVGRTASQMCSVKESGINLSDPINTHDNNIKNRSRQALALYLKDLISYCLKAIEFEFQKKANDITLPGPIPFVVSGGTSKAGGFMDLFNQEFDKVRSRFSIDISEVIHAKDPLSAVAAGLLIAATE